MKEEIQELPITTRGNMFMVSKKEGGQTPIINIKYLNFKMEGLQTVKALLQEEHWMAKIDLKDAFFMVPVATQFHHLLLFKVGTKVFQFKCLPFGLCMAPGVFT